jgi:mono/diheme cytochrome c family protein
MKKKILPRILAALGICLVLAIVIFIGYVYLLMPSVPLQEHTVQITPDRVERGRYLANHVMVCIDCHSTRDWSKFSGPPVPGTEGKGGEVFDQKLGFPGSFHAVNITPFNLSGWTDAEIYRAITSGVSKDGHPLFPIMPYPYYGTLDTEDIYSIIAYIRSLPPIDYTVERSTINFPMSMIIRMIPEKAAPQPKPPVSDTLKYGEYVVRAAGCIECHTPAEHGQIVHKLAFSGGREFKLPDGMLVSPNITPDKNTGIGNWSLDAFITRFKGYDPATYTPAAVKKGEMQSIMPWTMYAGMDTTDLTAMYRYLFSLEPRTNKVVIFRPDK